MLQFVKNFTGLKENNYKDNFEKRSTMFPDTLVQRLNICIVQVVIVSFETRALLRSGEFFKE